VTAVTTLLLTYYCCISLM